VARRDRQTAEQEIAAQRAGEGPDPTRGGELPPKQAAKAALAATTAAAGVAASAPPYIAPALTVAAVNAAAAGILGSFDRFLDARRSDQEHYVNGLLEAEVPDLPEAERLQLVADELDAERQFAMKVRQRLDRDLPKALSIADPGIRESEVRKILDRERRYVAMREQAMATRTLGTAEQRRVERLSPEGGFWHLSEHVREHTLDCLAMGNKVWPHSVLRTYHPPLHGGCPCEIWTIQEAEQAGLLHSPTQWSTPDHALQAMQIAEAGFDDDEFAEELAVLEAFYDARWGKGTTKAGQFRPKRGGDPGRVLRHERLARMRMPHFQTPAVAAVPKLDRQLDVRDLKVTDLREGDHVIVNGNLERITKVHAGTPGLFDLEHTGMAHIDREHIQGVPGEAHPPPDTGLPELPKFGPDDRYELRHGTNGSLIVWDREKNKADGVYDHGWDLEHVTRDIRDYNAQHRAITRQSEPAPPSPHGVSFADVEQKLLTRKMGKAGEAGPILPGFHYAGPSESGKVSYKHEMHGDTLHLQQGFFRQGRDRREKIVFGHYGNHLANALGDAGLQRLGEQDAHLSSQENLIGTYHALNVNALRQRMVDLHPDAARLVAGAAHERGLPLHTEAAKLVREPASVEKPPEEHPAHDLARRQVGLGGSESRGLLQEAGYNYGGTQGNPDGTFTHVFHNHEAGATIATTHNETGQVMAARADLPQLPEGDSSALTVGMESSMAIDRMRREGFSPGYTTSHSGGHDWLQFVHPDGRGRALRLSDTQRVDKVAAFTPPDRHVADARAHVIAADPFAHAKPGDNADAIVNALHSPNSGWRMVESKNANELSPGSLPAGVEAFTTFTRNTASGQPPEHFVLHLRRAPEGHLEIINAGHGSLVHSHIIPTPDQRAAEVQAWHDAQAKAEQDRQAREEAAAAAREGLRAAAEQGDKATIEKAVEGYSTNDAVRLLRSHGFEVRGRQRRGRGADRLITYTLRGPGGSTIKVTGGYGFGNTAVTKIEVAGNPQAGKRTRLPEGQAPKNLNELLIDALGRADELGQRYGAGVHVTGIVQGGVSRGAAAHHEYNGTIAIRKSGEAKRLRDYLDKRRKGEPLSEAEHLGFYNDVETLQHEINHGVAKPGNEPGGLSFGPRHYQGLGKNVEEALTEEMGHVLAAEWLRSHGMTDVLAAVKRNPQHYHILGTYQNYRVQLRRILEDSGLPPEEWRPLVERMKFQMTPEERNAELTRLAGTDNLMHAVHGHGQADHRRHAEMQRHFEPVLRADLSDIADTEPTFKTKVTNRIVREGEAVKILGGQGIMSGVVTGIRGDLVRVKTDDGLELWYTQDMVR
jgi:hypothetical protein